jgi:hypothetical protein
MWYVIRTHEYMHMMPKHELHSYPHDVKMSHLHDTRTEHWQIGQPWA